MSSSKRTRNAGVAALVLLTLATGCNREKPEPAPSEAAVVPSAAATPAPAPIARPSAVASKAPPPLDTGALNDREDPDSLLRYYAAALGARDWAAAAKAWGEGSGVTAKTLKESYDRAEAPQLTVGKGISEGAAGSLYYEVPAMLRFGSGLSEHGSLVLRRVNDVDGATAEQLRWHIERSTIGQGQ
ncbi:hypothetical protein KRR38_22990 [Novosphingobium sp. G106]|nr:hypothetical protein [Novosphingobium sp. G106]